MRAINQLIIHHSVTDPKNKDIWAVSVDGHDYVPGLYIDNREYQGNYHYLIYQDGEIKHPVPDDRYTYHCGVYNINLTSLAVCFVGNFEENEPSAISLAKANELIARLKIEYNINDIYLHRDLYVTQCPGKNITIKKIMEAIMKLTYEQVRRGYLAILRREPDGGKKNVYIGSSMSEADFLCELGNSKEHTDMFNNSELWKTNNTAGLPTDTQYQIIDFDVYKKVK